MPAVFPAISKKKDRSGHCLAFPDVCKVPAPPAPFSPAPFPSVHAKKLAGARKKVAQAKKDLKKTAGKDKSAQKALSAMTALEKLILQHEGVLKKASKMGYVQAKKAQVKFEGQVVKHLSAITAHNGSGANVPPSSQTVGTTIVKAVRCV